MNDPGTEDSASSAATNRLQLIQRLLLAALVLSAVIAVTWTWRRAFRSTSARSVAPASQSASQSPTNVAENQIHDIRAIGDRIWVATSGGIIVYDRNSGATRKKIRARDGLSHDFVEHITVARDGTLWFCTFDQHLSLFDGRNWHKLLPHTKTCALREEGTRFVLEDSRGLMWIATAKQGVFTFDGDTWKNYTTADGLPSDSIRSIVEDRDGSIWICTTGGVALRARGRWTSYTTGNGLSHDDVWTCVIDDRGDKWFGTWGGGISRYDGRRWTTIRESEGVASNWVFSSKRDAQGRLWFGTFRGVSMWNGKVWRLYGPEHGLLGTDVYALEIDSDGYKWFGTFQGLSRLAEDDQTFMTIVQP